MKLQNILLPTPEICDVRELYYHEYADRTDLDGYFNLFYVEKHRIYTALQSVELRMELKGFTRAVIMHDREEIEAVELGHCSSVNTEDGGPYAAAGDGQAAGAEQTAGDGQAALQTSRTEQTAGSRTYTIHMPYDRFSTGVFWLRLYKDPEVSEEDRHINGYYEGSVSWNTVPEKLNHNESAHIETAGPVAGLTQNTDSQMRDTECFEGDVRNPQIAVAICTYRREEYVIRNMRRLMALFEKERELAGHYHIFVIDNGQTLRDNEEFRGLLGKVEGIYSKVSDPAGYAAESRTDGSSGLAADSRRTAKTWNCVMDLTLIDNPNTGGTGGYTRGMKEAIARKEELGLTNFMFMDDDASFDPDLFVRLYGLLTTLRSEYSDITVGGAMWREEMPYIQHSSGEIYYDFSPHNEHPLMDLRSFEECTDDFMTKPFMEKNGYCGWWCCCYSMEAVRENELPLPLFIHGDDIQFGIRNAQRGLLYLNGIGVWHQSFDLAFPGVKRYYNARNLLITSVLYEPELGILSFIRSMMRQISSALLVFRYPEMELSYRGILDFLKGPDWLDRVDSTKLNQELSQYYRDKVQMKPLEELLGDRYPAFAAKYLTEEHIKKLIKIAWDKKKVRAKPFRYLTLNGWILPPKNKLTVFSFADTPWKAYRAGRILAYEPESKRGYIAERDMRQMIRAAGMELRLGFLLFLKYRTVARKWRARAGV